MSKRPKPISVLLSATLAAALSVIAGGCLFSPERAPDGRLTGYVGCKDFLPSASDGQDATPGPGWECLEYDCDGKGTLRLKHVNAGFNCCPGTISAEIVISEGEIRIREDESSALCDCNCLFDLDYAFSHLAPASTRISVSGPYLREGDPPLDFVIDLERPGSGAFCVERTHYPWSR